MLFLLKYQLLLLQETQQPMKTIGFATEFYTLWEVDTQPVYFTDSYGVHHLTGTKTNYGYIQNVSTDLDKVKALFPGVVIDESLRGKSRSFSVSKEEDTTPHILKFGRHCGRTIQDVCDIDFNYILWLIENANNVATRNLCKELPTVKAHFEKIEMDREARMNALPVIESGLVEVEFQTNPNHTGAELNFIYKNSSKLLPVPSTLVWEVVNEFSSKNNNDWFMLERAKCATHIGYSIMRYRDSNQVSVMGHNFDTIEEAKQHVEIQELMNACKLSQYEVPTEYTPFMSKHYAIASIGEGNTIYVFFDQIKEVNGMYPYNMAVINGKAMRLKGKKLTLNLNVFHTEKGDTRANQYATIV